MEEDHAFGRFLDLMPVNGVNWSLKSIQHALIRALKMVKMSVTRWAFKKKNMDDEDCEQCRAEPRTHDLCQTQYTHMHMPYPLS